MQIGDENVHLVRNVLDEVFGATNFCNMIAFKKTGGLIQAQEGLAYLATRTQAQVLPLGIVGTPDLWPMLTKFRRAHITFTIGPAFTMQTQGKPTREQLRSLTEDGMHRLAAVLPPEMRGVYK